MPSRAWPKFPKLSSCHTMAPPWHSMLASPATAVKMIAELCDPSLDPPLPKWPSPYQQFAVTWRTSWYSMVTKNADDGSLTTTTGLSTAGPPSFVDGCKAAGKVSWRRHSWKAVQGDRRRSPNTSSSKRRAVCPTEGKRLLTAMLHTRPRPCSPRQAMDSVLGAVSSCIPEPCEGRPWAACALPPTCG